MPLLVPSPTTLFFFFSNIFFPATPVVAMVPTALQWLTSCIPTELRQVHWGFLHSSSSGPSVGGHAAIAPDACLIKIPPPP
jgi:hypothetical protein